LLSEIQEIIAEDDESLSLEWHQARRSQMTYRMFRTIDWRLTALTRAAQRWVGVEVVGRAAIGDRAVFVVDQIGRDDLKVVVGGMRELYSNEIN